LGRVDSIAEGSHKLAVEARVLPKCHIVSESAGPYITVRRDIDHEVSPKTHDVVLVVSIPAIFQGKTDLPGARIKARLETGAWFI
jgi:hypothetical protein